ncbi:hypothetical protein PUN28_004171 [Cardiocondyla obscurior]|uniref:Uncharacterized protein n=1 Tax=Cardiocondyla obscurior TaxID=286306 RepID=A0AAW2GPW3_9HYME
MIKKLGGQTEDEGTMDERENYEGVDRQQGAVGQSTKFDGSWSIKVTTENATRGKEKYKRKKEAKGELDGEGSPFFPSSVSRDYPRYFVSQFLWCDLKFTRKLI